MAIPVIESGFYSGELSPELFGRVDITKFHTAASTMRNLFVSYKGGAYSRPGTAFAGYSKQTGRNFPPRLITFQFSINQGLALEFGNEYMRVLVNGAFVTEAPLTIISISKSNPIAIEVNNNYNIGDWLFVTGVAGMTQVNGQIYIVSFATATEVVLEDVFGNNINSLPFNTYTGGGTIARIYTLPTPYSENDLEYLKFTQSADVMTICCWNQITNTLYPPMVLSRLSDNNWTLVQPQFSATIAPPTNLTTTSFGGGEPQLWNFAYCVTAVDLATGEESIASSIATITGTANPAIVANSITVNWSPSLNGGYYNVYRALGTLSPGADTTAAPVPIGSLFGIIGSTYGTSFVDSNVVADFAQVPPTHQNPFAPGAINFVQVTATGSGFNQATVGYEIVTTTGSGAILIPIIIQGAIIAVYIQQAGINYAQTDTIIFTGGTGATANLNIGPNTGTYPSTCAYFQERLVYASTPNSPDTYFMSQPGLFNNFDSRIPTDPDDSIIGAPWSQEVNGIQYMVNMPGGLVVLTGLSAWQLTGAGGSSLNPQPLTPANQQAQPQAYNGCSAIIPPIKIDLDILYVQAKGSIIRDIEYQIFQNQYFGSDLTILSSQLFTGFTIREWAYSEEPYKIIWVVRDDGILLSLSYLKQQQISGWARHDTNGLFQSVTTVTEPPVDAVYVATQRFINGQMPYMIERMNSSIWESVEDCWCVDAGLQSVQGTPAGTLTVNSATGLGAISGIANWIGGQNYSSETTAIIIDNNGNGFGTGAILQLNIIAGIIQLPTIVTEGAGYINPVIIINDPLLEGFGASGIPTLTNTTIFTCSSPIFTNVMADQNWVIRVGGGKAVITSYISPSQVVGNIISPITDTIPNSLIVIPATSGNWTLTQPQTIFNGLTHLVGATVTGLADGQVIPPQIVSSEGTITLQNPATAVTIGLPFQVQLQSMYLDAGNPSVQGQRKKIANVTARVVTSGNGITIGSNQPDGSVQSPIQVQTTWNNMQPADILTQPPAILTGQSGAAAPLFSGDIRIPVEGGFDTKGQVALQQLEPLPLKILALIPEVDFGDIPQSPGPQTAPPQQRR